MRALALGRSGQCRDAADARIQTLGDALDDAAFAGGVAPFEDDNDLQFLVHDPVLQLDELALQAKQVLEVEIAVDRVALSLVLHERGELFGARVVELHLELLVDGVDQLAPDLVLHTSFAVAAHELSRSGAMPCLPGCIVSPSHDGFATLDR